ncbi:hypothetical protein L9F63_011176, partial [Diploptera punctata]
GIFKDKTQYPTLTRMSYCQCRLILVFSSIFKQFNWRHIGLIVDRSDLFSITVGKNLEYGLRKQGLLCFIRELDGNEEDKITYHLFLGVAFFHSVRGSLVRKFMLAAYALGMTRGEWTFLDGHYWNDHDWQMGDSYDWNAKKAYEALLRVSLLTPTSPKFQEFADKVRNLAKTDYNYTFSGGEEVNFFVGAFYDGVYLLGMALHETLNEGDDLHNGTAITRRMWNRNFHGVTGHVRIDDNGDRDADYSVLDLDPITGRFEVVAHYYGLHRNYTPVNDKTIHWPGSREGPPPDIPPCGFMGNEPSCHSNEAYVMILYASFAFGIFLCFAITLTYIAYKRMQVTADLNNMSWRIRPEEVLLEVGKPFSSRLGLQKNEQAFETGLEKLHRGRGSMTSCNSLPPTRVFTSIGIYKGTRVAIKKVTIKKKLDINHQLLWEIKQVRDVTHENTVRFVGACIEYPVVLCLTEYCPKGSLKDVLENDELQLDWNFRMSLIHDVVKDVYLLYGRPFGVHGKLRSGNCLIDGRFVLKISDFGLKTLTTPSEVIKDQLFYTKLLWVAPELIPSTVIPGSPATQKGDVYSFAIILEEIVVRGGPFEAARQFLEPQEIITRVAAREAPAFRPVVGNRDCPDELAELMERCWVDSPDERPTFESIRSIIRLIRKGYCENLMDDLLHRMEQYANNLEALVEEKTEQLSQEKRRSEELLYQVLPRPVAQQLMAGEMVRPEQFECVTVYFSDIVGTNRIVVNSCGST